jgi:hypothetical protein
MISRFGHPNNQVAGKMTRADQQFRVDIKSVARRLASAISVFGSLPRTEYRSIVAEVVADLTAQRVPAKQVYRMTLGAFPTVVKEVLQELTLDNPSRSARGVVADHECPDVHPAPWEYDELDPIAAQWYFDVPSARRIMSYFPADAKSVVALGTPTVATMAACAIPEVTLVDISKRFWQRGAPTWLNTRVERVLHDLDDKVYDGVTDADIVIMDPPWYIENYRAWLKSAVSACREGGRIAVALPQMLTNRRSLPERKEVLDLLKSIGPVHIDYDALTYVTPSFETAVLEADDLNSLRRWRRADLAVTEVRNLDLPYEFQPFSVSEWKYREVCQKIARTWNEDPRQNVIPVIEPVGPHREYRLTGVGRNYLWSSDTNLITSQGRAALVRRWGALPRILDLQQAGLTVESAVMSALPAESAANRQALVGTLRTIFDC